MYYYYFKNDEHVFSQADIIIDAVGGPESYFSSTFIEKWWHVDNEEEIE